MTMCSCMRRQVLFTHSRTRSIMTVPLLSLLCCSFLSPSFSYLSSWTSSVNGLRGACLGAGSRGFGIGNSRFLLL
ncbi:hypothetical protein DL96DRAFT_1643474 [Flagelloscypha sp. PMI_526]|nr:hypothetical protein DL96DRAFT_1643474 [Flagelloscypha sp. PMI_526]